MDCQCIECIPFYFYLIFIDVILLQKMVDTLALVSNTLNADANKQQVSAIAFQTNIQNTMERHQKHSSQPIKM